MKLYSLEMKSGDLNCMLQLLALSEFNVFKLNDIISAHDNSPLITSLAQIYLSQVTIVCNNHLAMSSYRSSDTSRISKKILEVGNMTFVMIVSLWGFFAFCFDFKLKTNFCPFCLFCLTEYLD